MIDRRCEHVIIYGPPGAGKLTVARALAECYGLRVLDNHLSPEMSDERAERAHSSSLIA